MKVLIKSLETAEYLWLTPAEAASSGGTLIHPDSPEYTLGVSQAGPNPDPSKEPTIFECEISFPWMVAPLTSKYYGTRVQFVNESGSAQEVFKIWQANHFLRPFASEREIANGWNPLEDGHDHVEDQKSYSLACEIVRHLNAAGNNSRFVRHCKVVGVEEFLELEVLDSMAGRENYRIEIPADEYKLDSIRKGAIQYMTLTIEPG